MATLIKLQLQLTNMYKLFLIEIGPRVLLTRNFVRDVYFTHRLQLSLIIDRFFSTIDQGSKEIFVIV